MNRLRNSIVLSAAALLLGSGIVWAGFQALTPPTPSLAAWAPQGSLLAIEARDFAALLQDWSNSTEARTWLASDNYAGFSRSRLFGRLGEAQQQFAASAGLPPDMSFLHQVAGKESLFAWYDIGNLEFLYITHLPSAAAEQTPLLGQRSKFESRKAGADTFYLRSQGEPKRTVAFATHGDYLLLATREDLIANALLLMQSQGNLDLRSEHWYAAATSAATGRVGDLRMTLNLAAIVPSAYFRSYWVQRNITEMKQYSAAISDIYRTPEAFREERVLLPKILEAVAPAADLAPLLRYLPAATGVYRATAHPATGQIVSTLTERLLFRDIAGYRDTRVAPTADLSPQAVGSASDLETRIDLAPLPEQPLTVALAPLHSLLESAHPDAMLVASSTGDAPGHLFLPIHATVALVAASPWQADALESALTAALRARLTAGDNGLRWEPRQQDGVAWFELEGMQPLAFAIQGNVCILASDSEALLQSLRTTHHAQPELVTMAAGFNHAAERPRFIQLAALLDHPAPGQQPEINSADANPVPPGAAPQPDFFSGNMRSLSDTFQALESESFVEQPDPEAHVVRQTVIYTWKH